MMVKVSLLIVVAALIIGVPRVAADNNYTIPNVVVSADNDDPDVKWVQIHAWFMWASMGFLLPLGTILIRYGPSQGDPRATPSLARFNMLFYLHIVVQCIGVGLATAGVAILIKTTGLDWTFTHRKLGFPLSIVVMMMPFSGIIRPSKGTVLRPYWFLVHWLVGTGVLLLGIVNCFTGIALYETVFPIPTFNIAFSVQVTVMCCLYILQGKWRYILSQGTVETEYQSKLPDDKTEDYEMGTLPYIPKRTPIFDLPVPGDSIQR